jgi:hypothetical protein
MTMPTYGAALATLATVLALAGCGGTPPPTAPEPDPPPRPSLLPPRPADLHADQVEVCSLLTPAQRAQLKIDLFGTDDNNTRVCDWSVGRGAQSYGWNAGFDRPKRSEQAARGTGAQVVQVGGFPTVKTSSSVFDPSYGCLYIIDIAPDQDFSVAYFNDGKDIPGMTHEKACQQAAIVAELTLANLKSQAR